jgi:hypothetical protein
MEERGILKEAMAQRGLCIHSGEMELIFKRTS